MESFCEYGKKTLGYIIVQRILCSRGNLVFEEETIVPHLKGISLDTRLNSGVEPLCSAAGELVN